MDNLDRQYYNSYFKNDVWPHACLAVGMTSPEMFNSIFKAFSGMLRVSKLVSLKWWLHFVFEKNKNGFPTIHTYQQGVHIWAAIVSSLKVII